MARSIPLAKKLQAICSQIEATGQAEGMRLTILKKWFEADPERLATFGLWIASRAASRDDHKSEAAGELAAQARQFLNTLGALGKNRNRVAVEDLHRRLAAFQNTHETLKWGSVRIIQDRDLFLIEEGLGIFLWYRDLPTEGYRLALSYCEHYDPKYSARLTGGSIPKITELMEFVQETETREQVRTSSVRTGGPVNEPRGRL